jgi:membrane protein YqaA with SNARE-associated domain
MRLFSSLYDTAIRWAHHRHAPRYLAGLSFAESSFFPVPPDVMLAPMVIARRELAWRFALLTTVASVTGGMFGYLIGMFFFDVTEPLIQQLGYWDHYLRAVDWFDRWGVWTIFLAGFTPIPYKVFTITAGAVAMAFLPFVLASLVGRGARFFLVAGFTRWAGPGMDRVLRRYLDRLGWVVIVGVIAAYFLLKS